MRRSDDSRVRKCTEDDEPWTDEVAVAESRAEFAAGRTISLEEILKKYG